jgi:hypothetical protein
MKRRVQVKCFEAGSGSQLEDQINDWIVTEEIQVVDIKYTVNSQEPRRHYAMILFEILDEEESQPTQGSLF